MIRSTRKRHNTFWVVGKVAGLEIYENKKAKIKN